MELKATNNDPATGYEITLNTCLLTIPRIPSVVAELIILPVGGEKVL